MEVPFAEIQLAFALIDLITPSTSIINQVKCVSIIKEKERREEERYTKPLEKGGRMRRHRLFILFCFFSVFGRAIFTWPILTQSSANDGCV